MLRLAPSLVRSPARCARESGQPNLFPYLVVVSTKRSVIKIPRLPLDLPGRTRSSASPSSWPPPSISSGAASECCLTPGPRSLRSLWLRVFDTVSGWCRLGASRPSRSSAEPCSPIRMRISGGHNSTADCAHRGFHPHVRESGLRSARHPARGVVDFQSFHPDLRSENPLRVCGWYLVSWLNLSHRLHDMFPERYVLWESLRRSESMSAI